MTTPHPHPEDLEDFIEDIKTSLRACDDEEERWRIKGHLRRAERKLSEVRAFRRACGSEDAPIEMFPA